MYATSESASEQYTQFMPVVVTSESAAQLTASSSSQSDKLKQQGTFGTFEYVAFKSSEGSYLTVAAGGAAVHMAAKVSVQALFVANLKQVCDN